MKQIELMLMLEPESESCVNNKKKSGIEEMDRSESR